MPKHNHVQNEQTNQTTNQQQDNQQPTGEPSATATDSQAETTNTEPLIGSLCPWTKHADFLRKTEVSELDIARLHRTVSGLHGLLRVLDAHREAIANEEPPLLNQNIEGALFDAATVLVSGMNDRLEELAEKAGKHER